MTDFVWDKAVWEHGEYVVTVRPDWEKSWRSIPIGHTMSSKDAEMVAKWLRSSCGDLRRLFYNESKDEQDAQNPPPLPRPRAKPQRPPRVAGFAQAEEGGEGGWVLCGA